MARIKALQFIHGMNTGGAETLVLNYVLNIDKDVFEPIVLCLEHRDSPYEKILEESGIRTIYHRDSPYEKILEESGIRTIYIEDYEKDYHNRFINKFIHHYDKYFFVKEIIKKESPDIIHIHLTLNKYVVFSNPRKDTKIFYTQHNDELLWSNNHPKEVKLLKKLIKTYDTNIIALNKVMAENLRKILQTSKITIINNGIPLYEYFVDINKDEIRKKLKIPVDSFLVCHVGRFSPVKNHLFLLEVFSEILKVKTNAHLLLVGTGPEEVNIRKKISHLNKTFPLIRTIEKVRFCSKYICFV